MEKYLLPSTFPTNLLPSSPQKDKLSVSYQYGPSPEVEYIEYCDCQACN